VKSYTIKIKSLEALNQARQDNPKAGIMYGHDATLYADKTFTRAFSYDEECDKFNVKPIWVNSYCAEDCLFLNEEIEYAKENV
jgi:hypothetical protein